MKAFYLLFLLIVSLSSSLRGQDNAPQVLDLHQCLQIALSKNTDLQRTALATERAKVNLQQERANLLPDINAGITHGINQGRSINPLTNSYINQEVAYASPRISSSLLLFNGLMQQNIIKQYNLIYKSNVEDEKQAKEQLKLDVMLGYLEVLTNQELLKLLQTQQQTTLKQLERLEVLNKSGAIAPREYYDLKGEYANDQLNLINAANDLENSKTALVKLLGIPYNKNMQLKEFETAEFSLEYAEGPEEIYQSSVRQLALVKAVNLRKKSADFEVRSLRSAYFPSIYFNSSLSSNFSNSARDPFDQPIPYFEQYSNNLSKSFSISLNLPLFNSFRTKNAIALSRINQRETTLLLDNTLTQLQQAVEQAYFNMKASKDRYLSLQEQVQAYKESFRTVEIRFNVGALTVVDYLIAKNNLDRATTNMITNRYDFVLRKKVLDFYQGKLTSL